MTQCAIQEGDDLTQCNMVSMSYIDTVLCAVYVYTRKVHFAVCCLCFTLGEREFDMVLCAVHVLHFDTVHCAVYVLH